MDEEEEEEEDSYEVEPHILQSFNLLHPFMEPKEPIPYPWPRHMPMVQLRWESVTDVKVKSVRTTGTVEGLEVGSMRLTGRMVQITCTFRQSSLPPSGTRGP